MNATVLLRRCPYCGGLAGWLCTWDTYAHEVCVRRALVVERFGRVFPRGARR